MYWTYRAKLINFGFILTLTIILVLGVFLFDSFNKNNKNEILVNHTYEVLATSKQLQSIIKDAETSQRGYIITDNIKYLEPLISSNRVKDSLSSRLSYLVSNNAHQIKEILRLEYLIKQKYNRINQILLIRKNSGKKEAINLISQGKGRIIMDSIRTIFNRFDKEEYRLLRQQVISSQLSNKAVKNILLIGIWSILTIFLLVFSNLFKQLRRLKKKEEQLFIENEWHNQILISMGDAVITTDTIGIVTMLNDAATKITGWTNEEAVGKSINQVVSLIDYKTGITLKNPTINALNENKTISLNKDVVLIRKDNVRIFIEDSGAPIHDKKGTIIGAVVILRDIHEKVKAEEERDMVYTISPDMIAIAGNDGFFKKVNPAFEKILGYTEQELLTTTFFEFIHKEDLEKSMDEFSKLIEGKPTLNFSCRFVCKNNTIKYLEWNVIPVGEVLYANARDITERHEAAQQIEASREKLYKILESNPVAIAITNIEEQKFKYVNESFCEMSGYSKEELLNHLASEFNMITHDNVQENTRNLDQNNSPAKNIESKFKKNDGSIIDVIFYVETIEIDEELCYLTTLIDITNRKKLENNITKLNQTLEKRVLSRTEALERQKKFTDNILNKIPTEIIVYDKHRKYLYANQEGIENEELRQWIISKTDYDYCTYLGLDSALADKRIEAFDKIENNENIDWIDEIIQHDGSTKFMLRMLHPIANDDKFILTGYDITHIKRAEQEREDYTNNLEQMMFMTSHQVRLPISHIIGLSSLLHDELTKEELQEIIGYVKNSIDNLDKFTHELTDFIFDLKKKTGI
jgi:PAS domain S-box-containing protein